MNKVIEIRNLTKEYKLGTVGRGTLYRDLQSFWAKIRNKEDPNSIIGKNDISSFHKKSFLALNSLDLDIYEGEIIGIIGANGAGKSTLLKILSKITGPTKGVIKIKGKIASLLEVGTGFHTELTGRENIFLNGTMNGLKIKEIQKKITHIIDFAGLEKFIDTPVKRYSSGMFVRLGFAVAAFLEPDILIVDEVLAVGDADFQKKALNKIENVSKNEKRTVLFVSHNMDAIKKLCSKVIIMDEGKILEKGPTDEMINKYLNSNKNIMKKFKKIEWQFDDNGPGGSIIKLKAISTKNNKNELTENFKLDEEVFIDVEFWKLVDDYQVCVKLEVFHNNKFLFETFDNYIKYEWGKQNNLKKGLHKYQCILPKNIFHEGTIDINVQIFLPPSSPETSMQVQHPTKVNGAISLILNDQFGINSSRGNYPYDFHKDSIIRPSIKWKND